MRSTKERGEAPTSDGTQLCDSHGRQSIGEKGNPDLPNCVCSL